MRKLTILAVVAVLAVVGVTFAALSLLGSGPAEAAGHKTTICHYDPGKVTQNKVHRNHSWMFISIKPGDAVDMHLANHVGPTGSDGDQPDTTALNEGNCLLRNTGLAALVADGPPGQAP